ncbi:XdhC family protein [Sphingoaurantiacus capsulatus]|uniref:XdhC family protein n=1 Tax=Sphingoaurantiacus capsulatus TaxID=1771310 RepID=A0ABV7XDA6_9SPHN
MADARLAGDELDRLLAAARDWLTEGHGVAIATVAETWGSAPRRAGSHLVVRDDGLFEGSVSGGCVEGDVIANALELIAEGGFRRLEYGVADATAWEVGLACGGRIAILVQAIHPDWFPPALLEEISDARRDGRTLALSTDDAGRTRIGEAEGAFINRYTPPLRLAIIGAVHIAQALAPMARQLGYAVTIIDPRGMFAAAARFEDATVNDRWPDEALAEWQPNAASAVVTLTHDPKLDDPALLAALPSPAFYVAALGSRRTQAARVERLAAAGLTQDQIARLHGPAGLDLGAANPSEIALSIAAQMTAAWRGRL